MKVQVYVDTDHTGVYGHIYISPMDDSGRRADRETVPAHISRMCELSEQYPSVGHIPSTDIEAVQAAFRAAGWTVLD